MKTLIVAEKPSVGRDIARVLKCGQKGDNCLYNDAYTVSWAIGHLVTLAEPEDYDPANKKWRMEQLPIIPETMKCKVLPKTRAQFNVIKKLMNDREIESIICATDSGREGELIFRYIYNLVGCKKDVKRLWISSMTDTAIKEGFAHLRDSHAYDTLYTSAKCRSEADWLVGMNATRAYTLQYGTLLSVGRVQTPTLAILVDRQREIDAFTPTDYWEVKAFFNTSDGQYDSLWYDPHFENEYITKIASLDEAEAVASRSKQTREGIIQSIKTEDKRQLPPQLFDLTELQRECNRVLGFSAQKTLSIAQALYEKHKLITYPRTDSRYISHDMIPKLDTVIKTLDVEPYQEAVAYVTGLDKLPVTGRIVDDAKVTDHHAIIPTGKKTPTSLSKDEQAVYDRIVRKFLAAFYPAQAYRVTTVITRVANDYFISKGRVIIEEGWTVLYKQDKPDKEERDDNKQLPPLSEGAFVTVNNTEVLWKKTQPPKAYTEATLLSAMEHGVGLGTPATRAAIIERLIEVGYIVRRRKNLTPTEKGIKLIGIVPEALRTPETTGKWERGLSRIEKSEMDEQRFMDSIKRYVHHIVEAAASGDAAAKKDLFPKEPAYNKKTTICACPKCGKGQILENTKGYYCNRWKEGCTFTIWKSTLIKDGKKADAATVRAICDVK